MPATNAWNEASPTGADFASSIDDFIRTLKLDIRERAAIDHVWNVSAAADGYHKSVTFKPSDNVSVVSMSTSPSLTGSNATNFFDLTQTWNTTGSPTFFKANITNTASGASALLMDLQVGSVSMFSVTKAGVVSDAVGSMATIRAGGLTVASAAAGDVAYYSSASQLGRVANANDATKFLNGAATPAFAQVKDSDLSTSDITTNDASTSKHGFLKKLPNNAAVYLDGTGAFSAVSSGAKTLLYQASGTVPGVTAAGNADTYALASQLDANDVLEIVLSHRIVTGGSNPTTASIYNVTDSVTIATGSIANYNSILNWNSFDVWVSGIKIGATARLNLDGTATPVFTFTTTSTPSPGWAGAWTIALRHTGVDGADVWYWDWAIWKTKRIV